VFSENPIKQARHKLKDPLAGAFHRRVLDTLSGGSGGGRFDADGLYNDGYLEWSTTG